MNFKTLLLIACIIASLMLLALVSDRGEIKVLTRQSSGAAYNNQDDELIRKSINDIVKVSFPGRSDVKWKVSVIEHRGDVSYVHATPSVEDLGSDKYKFIVDIVNGQIEPLGTYAWKEDDWELIYGLDPILSN